MSAQASYERTVQRRLYLESQGYTVVEMWDCHLRAELATNPAMKKFFESVKIIEPLNPREG